MRLTATRPDLADGAFRVFKLGFRRDICGHPWNLSSQIPKPRPETPTPTRAAACKCKQRRSHFPGKARAVSGSYRSTLRGRSSFTSGTLE